LHLDDSGTSMGRLGFRTWTWGVGGLPSLVAWALGAVVRAWALAAASWCAGARFSLLTSDIIP